MERPGFCGIFNVTIEIIHSNRKHFMWLAFTFMLPYALKFVAFPPASTNIAASFLNAATTGDSPPPLLLDANDATHPYPPNDVPTMINAIIFLISGLFIALVCEPPVTFSICRGRRNNKKLKLKGSLMAIPRSIINIIITNLFILGAYMGAMMIMNIFFAVNGLNPGIRMILFLVLGIGVAYLSTVSSLAIPVTILEERRGWDAMRRSMYLLRGSKWLAFRLLVSFLICRSFLPISASEDASMVWKFSVATASVYMQAIINFCSIANQVVFYLSCKSYHNEPVKTLMAEQALNLVKIRDPELASLNAQV